MRQAPRLSALCACLRPVPALSLPRNGKQHRWSVHRTPIPAQAQVGAVVQDPVSALLRIPASTPVSAWDPSPEDESPSDSDSDLGSDFGPDAEDDDLPASKSKAGSKGRAKATPAMAKAASGKKGKG